MAREGIENLFQDYGITIADDSDRHYREGWVNVPCPYCTGNSGNHLGFNLLGGYFFCWRCEGKPLEATIRDLLSIPYSSAENLVNQYKLKDVSEIVERIRKTNTKPFKLPTGVTDMKSNHKNYLFRRDFNPRRLAKKYGVQGTGPVSSFAGLNLCHRLLIPIYWKRQLVSWQTRLLHNKNPNTDIKYLTCPEEYEILHHKHIVYCKDGILPKGIGICVEGVFDVQRIGNWGFGTFGISYTPIQMQLIAHNFKRVFIWFDPEPQAQVQAEKLSDELRFRRVETVIVRTTIDPAACTQQECNYLVKQLTGRRNDESY